MKGINKIAWVILMVCSFLITTSVFSQTLKNVFSKNVTSLIYLGIDFSKAKLLDDGKADEIRNRFYGSINQLIVQEPKKYALTWAFRKSHVDYELDAVNKANASANTSEILSDNDADFDRFKESDIADIVNNLDLTGKTGTGVIFIMEAMRKYGNKPEAAIWVTFIDQNTKKVLMTERMETKGKGGFGFRNYWVSVIKDLIDEIDDRKYNEWQAKYSK